ncbi:hypothetical protein [Martelella soudanensis]|uniref:hypothetical protein n=1 Tax=unclassified Martelella TaxID=2629616 RepID=UPI0015DF77EC|nr:MULTISPECIES: hypothetical protein [unclassified Martelella]
MTTAPQDPAPGTTAHLIVMAFQAGQVQRRERSGLKKLSNIPGVRHSRSRFTLGCTKRSLSISPTV